MFVSLDDRVKTPNDIERFVGEALKLQHKIDKISVGVDLTDFTIQLNNVENLIYIFNINMYSEEVEELIIKMKHKGKSVYVQMNATLYHPQEDGYREAYGTITVCSDTKSFLKNMKECYLPEMEHFFSENINFSN